MKKWISSILGLIVLIAVAACKKADNPDIPLPDVVHIKSECPENTIWLEAKGKRAPFVFTKTADGMIWESGNGEQLGLIVDGKRHEAKDRSGAYVGGCQGGGFRVFLKARGSKHVSRSYFLKQGDGFDLESDAGKSHARRAN